MLTISRPHYGWWGYVKDIIRRYPTLCEQEKALHETCISPDLSGMPHGSGNPTDPVADAALRELPEINRREMEAVRQAIELSGRSVEAFSPGAPANDPVCFLGQNAYTGRGSNEVAPLQADRHPVARGVYTVCS